MTEMEETGGEDLTSNDEFEGSSPSSMSFIDDTERGLVEFEKFSLDSIANQVMEQVSCLGESLKSYRNEGCVAIEILQAALSQANGINSELTEQKICIENLSHDVKTVYPNLLGGTSSRCSTAGPSRSNTLIPQFSYRTAPQQQSPQRTPDEMEEDDINNEIPAQ